MKLTLLLLVICSISMAQGGEIFGSVKADGKLVGKGVKIEVQSGTKVYKTETDNYGSFRCFITDKGKCVLKVAFGGASPTLEVYSFAGSTRYDLLLDKKDGKYQLRRK